MKAVTVVGGGFSGLATAYHLSRAGIPVEIIEKTDRLGGLIATLQTPTRPRRNGGNRDAEHRSG